MWIVKELAGAAVWFAIVGAAVATAPLARADEAIITAGAEIVAHGTVPGRAACSSCHRQDGAGEPEVGIPRLAGLSPYYIASQLEYFASGARHSYVMSSYAAALTPAQRQEVAYYYASLPVPAPADPIPAPAAAVERGRTIFLNGDPHTGLLSCSQCHGTDGLGVGSFSPRLAGQSANYILDQLRRWHDGELRDPKGQYMRAIAGHLSADDMRAVADYAASVPGQGKAQP